VRKFAPSMEKMYPLPEEHFGLTGQNLIKTCNKRTALKIKIKPFPDSSA
tara:strand:+ start:37 stop:183 length:147 start_codon:yes stop_codon:yes gene_type:complete